MRKMKLMAILFDGLGVVFIIIAALVYSKTRTFIAESTATEGTVVELELSSSGSSRYYYPVVVFRTAEELEIRFKSGTGSNPPSYREGDKVPVRYRQDDPYGARIDSFFSLWGLVVILGPMGLLFSAIGTGIFVAFFRTSRKDQDLALHGRVIHADLLSVDQDFQVRVAGRRPFRIACQWQDSRTGKVYVFQSKSIWFDPRAYIPEGKIPVKIDPNDPRRYRVDISFLPEQG